MVLPFIIAGTIAAAAAYTYFGANLVSAAKAKEMIRSGKIRRSLMFARW